MKFEDNHVLRKIYITYQGFLTLLKLDAYVNLVLLAFIFIFVTDPAAKTLGFEIIVLPIAFVITIFANILAFVTMKFEKRWIVYPYIIWLMVEPIYIIYKLSKMTHTDAPDANELSTALSDHKLVVYWIVGLVAFFERIGLIVITILVMQNFGKGLKSTVTKENRKSDVSISITDAKKEYDRPVSAFVVI